MGGGLVKKVFVLYGLVLATVLRIIIPFAAGSQALMECPQCTRAVVTYYSAISSALFIVATMLVLSIRLADRPADWSSAAYVPMLILMISWTFYTSTKQLNTMEDSYEDCIEDLSQDWWGYFNHNDTYWPDLERKLQCCGLEGPRGYMDYLRRVPEHCYSPQLITLGCKDIVQDLLHPMLGIGHLMRSITLFVELCLLCLHVIIVVKKLVSYMAGRSRRRVPKPSLNKSN